MVSKRGDIQHVEINVSNLDRSGTFYQGLLLWLGYKRILDEKEVMGWGNGDVQIFLVRCGERFRNSGFHRKRVGLNHVAFRAKSKTDVDKLHDKFLVPRNIKVLYGGPKEYPQYGKGYYAVYFEDRPR